MAVDEADLVDADAYLDTTSFDATADDIDELGEESLPEGATLLDLEVRPEDLADLPETLPAGPESDLPGFDQPADYSDVPEAIVPDRSDYDAGAGFDSGGTFDAAPPMDTDMGGFEMPMDGGGGFDGGMDMDMGGGDVDF